MLCSLCKNKKRKDNRNEIKLYDDIYNELQVTVLPPGNYISFKTEKLQVNRSFIGMVIDCVSVSQQIYDK